MPEQKRHERVVMRAVKTAKPVEIENVAVAFTVSDDEATIEGVCSGAVLVADRHAEVRIKSIDKFIDDLLVLRRAMRRAGFKTGGRNADR